MGKQWCDDGGDGSEQEGYVIKYEDDGAQMITVMTHDEECLNP